MAISIVAVQLAEFVTIPAYYVIEAGGKFFGILNWAECIVMVGMRALLSHLHNQDLSQRREDPDPIVAGSSTPATIGPR